MHVTNQYIDNSSARRQQPDSPHLQCSLRIASFLQPLHESVLRSLQRRDLVLQRSKHIQLVAQRRRLLTCSHGSGRLIPGYLKLSLKALEPVL